MIKILIFNQILLKSIGKEQNFLDKYKETKRNIFYGKFLKSDNNKIV